MNLFCFLLNGEVKWVSVCSPLHQDMGKCVHSGGREGKHADNDSSLFTLITQSRVSADGWWHKGASMCSLRVGSLREQSRTRGRPRPLRQSRRAATDLVPEVGRGIRKRPLELRELFWHSTHALKGSSDMHSSVMMQLPMRRLCDRLGGNHKATRPAEVSKQFKQSS